LQSSKNSARPLACPLTVIRRAQASGPDADGAKLQVILAYRPLVGAVIKRLGIRANDYDDAESGGTVGILEALKRFDSGVGVPFGVFARGHVLREVLEAVYAGCKPPDGTRDIAAGAGQMPVSDLPAAASEEPEDLCAVAPLDELIREETTELVRVALGTMPARGRDLVYDVFWNEKSQADIARTNGVSRVAINKVFLRTMHKLSLSLAALN